MGNSLYRLEVIKARLVASDPSDLNPFFKFIEDQLTDAEPESFDIELPTLQRIRSNVSEISVHDLECILDFVAEQIPINRTADKAARILNNLDKTEFYSRELRYSKIERFIFTLTKS